MIRTIDGFDRDDLGDWIAQLSCFHRQHVRHRPPFVQRAWVLTTGGRAARVGSEIECPLCDTASIPDGLRVVRTAGPFDDRSVPPGLLRDHRIADRTWGQLRVIDGRVRIVFSSGPPLERELGRGETQHIPPGASHFVQLSPGAAFVVDFLTT